jgi:hypothetical protein
MGKGTSRPRRMMQAMAIDTAAALRRPDAMTMSGGNRAVVGRDA